MRFAASLPALAFALILLPAPALAEGGAAVRCRTCHVRDTPTKQDPALVSCPRAAMKGSHALEQAPRELVLGSGAAPYGPVKFAHRDHARMAEMGAGCVSCHHYNLARPIQGCGECHPLDRARQDLDRPARGAAVHRQCLECHSRAGGEPACASCHGERRPKAPLEPPAKVVFRGLGRTGAVSFAHAEHVSSYGASCTQCHQGQACSDCHTPAAEPRKKGWTLEKAMRGAPQSEAHRACVSCHSPGECAKCHAGAKGGGP